MHLRRRTRDPGGQGRTGEPACADDDLESVMRDGHVGRESAVDACFKEVVKEAGVYD